MKRNPSKQFRIVEEVGDQVKLIEIDEDLRDIPGTEKEIKRTTFKRSYGRKKAESAPAEPAKSTLTTKEEDGSEHKYWYHPESKSAVVTTTEEQAQKVASDGCVEISKAEYEGIIHQQLQQEMQEDTREAAEESSRNSTPVAPSRATQIEERERAL